MKAEPSPQEMNRVMEKIITILKLSGIVMLVGGAAIALGLITILPWEVGIVFVIVGLADLIIIAPVLRKAMRKKSDDFIEGNRPQDKGHR